MKAERFSEILLSGAGRLMLLLVISIGCTMIASATTYTVTKTADTNGVCNSGVNCSLREAIAVANTLSTDDIINFVIPASDPGCSGGVCTITLSSSLGQLVINSASTSGSLTIINTSSTQRIEISGNDATRVFQVNSGANLTISNITIRNGRAGNGGGIRNEGTLTMTNCTVSGNSVNTFGGGIFNLGTLTMTNCTVSGNSISSSSDGGGIYNAGTLTMTNCTVSGNSVGRDGGGIRNLGTLNLNNSIVANNTASSRPDIYGSVSSGDFNLIGNTSGIPGTLPGSNNITNQDPKLAPLGNYGGPTQTQPPLPNSPAINAGSNALIPAGVSTDQRGAPRITQTTVDIGAVELTTRTVTSINDSGAGTLREIMSGSTGIADIINFNIASGCSGGVCVITLSSTLVANPGVGLLYITNEGGTQRIEISGNNSVRVFQVNSGANLTINNITIRNGSGDGGGIRNEGMLTMTNCTVSGNSAGLGGGGIYNEGTLTMTNCTVSGNSANGSASLGGGGIFNSGTLTMTNCTVSGNSTGYAGGGIRNSGGTVNARNTIIANNSALSGPDFYGTLNSQGYNLIRNASGVGSSLDPSDIVGEDPLLTPLGYYGGLTWTRALFIESSAINSGDNCVKVPNCTTNNPPFAITIDQRGASRTRVDIGAYEVSSFRALLPNARAAENYNLTITQYDVAEGSYTYTMSGLPSGLTLSQTISGAISTVQITGTPTQTGNFTPTLTIVDNSGRFATIYYSLFVAAPTAASVSISGRVFGGSGKGLRNAYVILTDEQGRSRTVQTSAFGYYRFEEVEVGRTYILTVQSKRYEFEPQVVFVTDEITELNFYPVEYRKGALDRFDSSLEER